MVSVLCAVCGSYGGRVAQQSLLSNCFGAPTPGRLLALRDELSRFLPGSKRTVHLDSVPWGGFACLVWSMSQQGPISCPGSPSSLVAAALLNVAMEPALNLPKLHLSVSDAVLQLERLCLVLQHEWFSRRSRPPAKKSPQTRSCQGQSNMWCPLLEAAYQHCIGGFLAVSTCHSSKAALSQSCHLALFVDPVARSSTDQFFTLCDVHLDHQGVSQAPRLQRRHGAAKLQESCGSHCRRGQLFREVHHFVYERGTAHQRGQKKN